jgi:hypothetical protein
MLPPTSRRNLAHPARRLAPSLCCRQVTGNGSARAHEFRRNQSPHTPRRDDRVRGIAVTPSRDAARSLLRGRGRCDGGRWTGPLAHYRLAPRRREITFGRQCDSRTRRGRMTKGSCGQSELDSSGLGGTGSRSRRSVANGGPRYVGRRWASAVRGALLGFDRSDSRALRARNWFQVSAIFANSVDVNLLIQGERLSSNAPRDFGASSA